VKNRIEKGFNFLAPFYDGLARLIIGKDIVNSQLSFLKSFKECKRLLILGGGSGWILDALSEVCPDLQIDYIDLSPAMLNAAKERSINNVRINFIQGTENNIPDRLYDGVITNFYLDMFDEKKLPDVIEKIKSSLISPARWVVTDFVNERRAHNIMLNLMYLFFRTVTGIQATHLPDWQNEMKRAGCRLLESRKFSAGFILSNHYQTTALAK
jgi:tRNA (cmo5U34)-methyltransferase